jgi:threonine/homoserine/homoserine lactone efflux protein
MLSIQTIVTFFGASVLLALAPGPDNVFVLLHSAVHGRKAGMLVVLGLCSGLLFHTAAVALGLAALFAASATAFTALKLLGAAYLLWLAWQSWKAPAGMEHGGAGTPLTTRQTYLRGVLMNLTNPKVAIFFLAFLPQFADPATGSVAVQVMLLGLVFIVAALCTFGAIAWFASSFGEALRKSARAQTTLNRLASLVFTALALRLIAAER